MKQFLKKEVTRKLKTAGILERLGNLKGAEIYYKQAIEMMAHNLSIQNTNKLK